MKRWAMRSVTSPGRAVRGSVSAKARRLHVRLATFLRVTERWCNGRAKEELQVRNCPSHTFSSFEGPTRYAVMAYRGRVPLPGQLGRAFARRGKATAVSSGRPEPQSSVAARQGGAEDGRRRRGPARCLGPSARLGAAGSPLLRGREARRRPPWLRGRAAAGRLGGKRPPPRRGAPRSAAPCWGAAGPGLGCAAARRGRGRGRGPRAGAGRGGPGKRRLPPAAGRGTGNHASPSHC